MSHFLRTAKQRWSRFYSTRKPVVLLSFAAWLFLVLLTGKKSLTYFLINDIPPNYELFYSRGMLIWTLAAGFSPFILRLARRFPIRGSYKKARFLLHTVFSVAFMVLLSTAFTALWLLWFNPSRVFENFTDAVTYNMMWLSLIAPTVYWLMVGGYHLQIYYTSYQKRREKAILLRTELKKIQLRILQMQLQPHFLFNALNTVSALIYEDLKAADRMIEQIKVFLEKSTSETDHAEVSLQEELEFVDTYLGIEKNRFGDRLAVEKQVDEGSLEGYVPRMVLQPIVENAVRHGISKKEGQGRLLLKAERVEDRLSLVVEDSGKGIPDKEEALAKGGLGIKNTIARLKKLYNQDFRFDISESELGGARILLVLPWHKRNDQELN